MVFTETLSWGLQQFFSTGTYAGIGTCVEFENVMKSAMKKNLYFQVNSTLLFTSHDNIAYLSPDSRMKQGVLPEMQILP